MLFLKFMSSHHFVKENQEPAVIFANGAECSWELTAQVLEWSPYVLVLDGALERVLSLGIKIDAVLGDFDSARHVEKMLVGQEPVEIVHTPDQEKTDLEKGLDFLISKNHRAAHIIWGTGRRTDHTLANISNMVKYKHALSLTMIDDHSRIYPLPSLFQKKFVPGSILSLMPIGKVEGIETEGLQYNLYNEPLEIGGRIGSSNQAAGSGLVKVAHKSGNLVLMESWD